MELTVNGEKRKFEDAVNLDQVIGSLDLIGGSKGIAVAVNDTVVPQPQWRSTTLCPEDRIEVIQAVQGG